MNYETDPKWLTVECPTCKEPPGKPCTSWWQSGAPIPSTHNKRALASAKPKAP